MKHLNRHHLALLPLLTLLAWSGPHKNLKSSDLNRSIASVEDRYPLYHHEKDQLTSSSVDSIDNIDELGGLLTSLENKVRKTRDEFKRNESNQEVVASQRKIILSFVSDLSGFESDLKLIKDMKEAGQVEVDEKLIEQESAKVSHSKKLLEELLAELTINEKLVQNEKIKEQELIQLEASEKQESQESEVEISQEEESQEEESQEQHACSAQEENKVLTSKVEELMKQQSQILNALVGVTQLMAQMNQQNQGIYKDYQFQTPHPYMYQQPMTSGNWVYYPDGFSPNQINIFSVAPSGQQSIQPNASQNQSNWQLTPTYQIQDPRFNSVVPNIGEFRNDPFSFNFSSGQLMTQR